jgi:hypothetical protein
MHIQSLLIAVTTVIPGESTPRFDPIKAKMVRDSVYNNRPLTASPQMDFRSELVMPDELTDLYRKHPQEVLDVLEKIIDGGNPKDSVLAAGCAISLLKGPRVGVVCVDNFDRKTYDTFDTDWEATPREHWLRKVKSIRMKKD